MSRGRVQRAAIYSGTGFVAEIAFSTFHDAARGRDLTLRTSPWMLPIYALIQPLYEPLHDATRNRFPAWARALTYGAGFLGVEYATGAFLRRVRGRAPWDYSDARRHIHGLIRPDYLFLWAAAGLALESFHDRLTDDE